MLRSRFRVRRRFSDVVVHIVIKKISLSINNTIVKIQKMLTLAIPA